MKIKELLNKNIRAMGFNAIQEIEDFSDKGNFEEIIYLSSLSPAIMLDQGIEEYYALEIPRNSKFNTGKEILDANLNVNLVRVTEAIINPSNLYIVSRHQGTINILKGMYQNALLLDGNLTAEQLQGKDIIGTLPPHLISACNSYIAITIDKFDYAKDGDLQGKELQERLRISNPISVRLV